MKIDLEGECDPPSYTAGQRKLRMKQVSAPRAGGPGLGRAARRHLAVLLRLVSCFYFETGQVGSVSPRHAGRGGRCPSGQVGLGAEPWGHGTWGARSLDGPHIFPAAIRVSPGSALGGLSTVQFLGRGSRRVSGLGTQAPCSRFPT